MFKKLLLTLFTIIFSSFLYALSVSAQTSGEMEPASSSTITESRLPNGAVRIMPGSVPAEIKDALKKLVEAGEGKIKQGDAEVLAWSGGDYRKANAGNLMKQLQANLQTVGWTYEAGEKNGEITVFSVLRQTPSRRGLLGFYVPTDDALVVAWTEILPTSPDNITVQNSREVESQTAPRQKSGNRSELVGTWMNGHISTMADVNVVTHAATPSNGLNAKYVFAPDGSFEYVGLLQSTMYGCTTSLFNHKTGRYEMTGSQVTLIPGKNFWRNTYSCSPQSNKERDYTLERETYEWRTKTDEYGKRFICLANAKGESCYRAEGK